MSNPKTRTAKKVTQISAIFLGICLAKLITELINKTPLDNLLFFGFAYLCFYLIAVTPLTLFIYYHESKKE